MDTGSEIHSNNIQENNAEEGFLYFTFVSFSRLVVSV